MNHVSKLTVLQNLVFAGILAALPCSLRSQTDLTEMPAEQADALIIKLKGTWVLESIDSRPVRGDCIGKVSLRFLPDHFVNRANCVYGQPSQDKQQWRIVSDGPYNEKVLEIQGEKKQFFLKDDGKGSKHQYHMRLRQNDVTEPKGGMNLEHDYKFQADSKP